MNKLFALVKRNFLEIFREPISLFFCIIFPIFMLIFMQIIFQNFDYVPQNFEIKNYSVGMCVFGFTFISLFTANLMASDKQSEFSNRINIAPIGKTTYIMSYFLALFPISFIQKILFFAIALFFGLPFNLGIFLALIYLIPSEILYITIGILIGVIAKNERQAGPFASIIVSVVSMLGGVFMPIDTMGNFGKVMNFLPFSHSVKIASGVFSNDYSCIFPHIFWVLGYSIIFMILALFLYNKNKKSN